MQAIHCLIVHVAHAAIVENFLHSHAKQTTVHEMNVCCERRAREREGARACIHCERASGVCTCSHIEIVESDLCGKGDPFCHCVMKSN